MLLHMEVNLADHLQLLLSPPSITENMSNISVDWMERQINSFGVLRGDPQLLKDKHQSGEWWEMVPVMDTSARTLQNFPGNPLYL